MSVEVIESNLKRLSNLLCCFQHDSAPSKLP
jgi:hypothetical protein